MKLTAKEIEQHFLESEPEETALVFVEPELDEVIESPYDSRQDDWLFDDGYNEEYNDRYDPYPHDLDDYF